MRAWSRGQSDVTKALCARGFKATFVKDGIAEGLRATGHALMIKPVDTATRWITRERPKVDRIACPSLIKYFIDPGAEFLYVQAAEVKARAAAANAIA